MEIPVRMGVEGNWIEEEEVEGRSIEEAGVGSGMEEAVIGVERASELVVCVQGTGFEAGVRVEATDVEEYERRLGGRGDSGLQGIPSSRLKSSTIWAPNRRRARAMNSWTPMLA